MIGHVFGNDDPRDAWDDNDRPVVRRVVLARIVEILEEDDVELREWIARKQAELDG